ncbi:MAG: membrane integrity-associated transporter subunit PqiC [Candidatus Hydrogenedentes bacterium]|nr:membrane integrity-associated transporter subunit PqiC [Candidatus Hydrogenedentota bacterium]
MKSRTLLLLPFLLALAGCKSAPPTKYYTLNMETSGRAQTPVNVVVSRVQVGEALSRRDIMIKQSPTQVEYYATNQWAAGLDELVRQKLQEEFGVPREGRPGLVLIATLLACEQIDVPGGADARVKLTAELRREEASRYDAPLLTKIYEARKKADTERPADVVQALSDLIEKIAEEIAQDTAALKIEEGANGTS